MGEKKSVKLSSRAIIAAYLWQKSQYMLISSWLNMRLGVKNQPPGTKPIELASGTVTAYKQKPEAWASELQKARLLRNITEVGKGGILGH